ncbi:hypothetical protein JTB14_028685 [Gonioctena quinquepunctata]|nr:hypothetical protein JTB14_028685 [Gonioctena quinquepunctata]
MMDQMMNQINEAVANSDQGGDTDAEDGNFSDPSTPSTSKRATRSSSSKINLCNSDKHGVHSHCHWGGSDTEDDPYTDNSDMDPDLTLDKKSK